MRNSNNFMQASDYEVYEQGKIISQWPRLKPRVGLIVKGTVSCYVQGTHHSRSGLSHFNFADDWLGLEHMPWIGSGRKAIVWKAETKCLVSFFPLAKVLEMLETSLGPSMYRSMMLSMSRQTGQVFDGLMAHTLSDQERFEKALARLAEVLGEPTEQGTLVRKISKVEIAKLTGVSREYASRQMKRSEEHTSELQSH